MTERKAPKNVAKKSAKKFAQESSPKGRQKTIQGFTDEERAAMRERAQEMKAGPRTDKADGETDVLAKIAAMPAPDRVMAERLHAIIKASAPVLSSDHLPAPGSSFRPASPVPA